MSGRPSIACLTLLPLLVALSDCAAQQQYAYDTGIRATEENIATSGQKFADQQKAEAKERVADYDHPREAWKSPFQAYADCNRSASRVVARQTGDPGSLAVAARDLCQTTEANLRTAIYAAYVENPNFGIDTMEKLRGAILENNTSDIVAARTAAARPRRSPGAESPPADRRT